MTFNPGPKVGANMLLWAGHTTIPEHGETIKQLVKGGAQSIELAVFDGSTEHYTEIGKFIRDLGVPLTFVTVANPNADPSSPDEPLRLAGIDWLKKVHDWAVAAGADGIVGPIALPWGAKNGFTGYADRAKRAADSLRVVAQHSTNSPLKFWGLEPLTGWEIQGPNTLTQVAEIIEAVDHPKFGVLWDMSHETHEGGGGKKLAEELKRIGPKLFHCHISAPRRGDPRKSWLHTLLPIYLNALDISGYEGNYVVEIFSPDVPGFQEGVSLTWEAPADKLEVMTGTIAWAQTALGM